MVLKREDAMVVAEEPLPSVFDDLGSGPYIAPTTFFKDFIREVFGTFVYQPSVYAEDRRDEPTISMGTGDILPVQTVEGNELSDLVIAESEGRPAPIFDEAPLNGIGAVYNMPATDWFDYWKRVEAGELNVPKPLYQPGTIAEVEDFLLTPVQDVGGTDVADFFDDLGDVVIGLAQQYLAPSPTMGFAAPPPGAAGVDPLMAPLGAPSAAACATGASPVYKKVCGVYRWVYPKRRRRRQLLTESDYNGLLRIESLKVNKNMTVAIAKALTR